MHGQRLLAGGRRKGAVQIGEIPRREVNVEGPPILANMLRLARLRDRADAVLTQHRGQRHAARGLHVRAGNRSGHAHLQRDAAQRGFVDGDGDG